MTYSRSTVEPPGSRDPLTGRGSRPDARAGFGDQVIVGLLAGIAGTIGMFVVLAIAARAQGHGFVYPLHAAHAVMSGGRVLPDYPGRVYGGNALDVIVAPLIFLTPGVLIGVVTSVRAGRRSGGRRDGAQQWTAAAGTALFLTTLTFVVFVGSSYRVGTPAQQRYSSGFGVREIGLTAWVVGHLVYVSVLLATLGPAERLVGAARRAQTRRIRRSRVRDGSALHRQPGR